jgi:hypothetical protein
MPLENVCLESKSSIIDGNYCEDISGVNDVLSKDVLVIKGMYVYVCICLCMYMCMYNYINIYIYIYICIYV